MVVIARKRIWGVIMITFLFVCLFIYLFSHTEQCTFWWYLTAFCTSGTIVFGVADICYIYAKYLIHKTTSED